MLWEILLIAACIVFILLLSFLLNHQSTKALLSQIHLAKEELAEPSSALSEEIMDIKEELLDMVHDTIKNLQPPNAFDHIMGALAGPIQMWAMKKAGIDPSTGKAIGETVEQLVDAVDL